MIILLFSLSFIINYPIHSAKRTNVKRAGIASKNSAPSQKRAAVSSARSNLSSKRMGARGKQTKAQTTVTNNTTSNNEKNCPVCPDCNTLSLEKQISYYKEEFLKTNNELADYKEKFSKVNDELTELKNSTLGSRNEDEATRLARLRIEKVPGTEDDYKCIKGWTNNWDEKLFQYPKAEDWDPIYITDSKIMDKYGVIKDEAERVKWGKYKKGCPFEDIISQADVKGTDYVYIYKYDEKSEVYIVTNKFIKPVVKPLIKSVTKITKSEDNKNCGYMEPVLLFAYFIDETLKGFDLSKSSYSTKNKITTKNYIGIVTRKDTYPKTIPLTDIIQVKYYNKYPASWYGENPTYYTRLIELPENPNIFTYKWYDVVNPIVYPFWDYEP